MNAEIAWCHQCDQAVDGWTEFTVHANAGHAVTDGRCPGACQFPAEAGLAA